MLVGITRDEQFTIAEVAGHQIGVDHHPIEPISEL